MLLKYFPCLPSPFHSQIHCCPLGLCDCSFELLKYLPTDDPSPVFFLAKAHYALLPGLYFYNFLYAVLLLNKAAFL